MSFEAKKYPMFVELFAPVAASDILLLEKVQCRATKAILNGYIPDYKSCLIKL